MDVTWDPMKASQNELKHGISFAESATVLTDPLAITFIEDSSNELRFITIGHSCLRQTLPVVCTEITPTMLRIISARKASKKEKNDYEKGI
jgi:uncharacterized DUF497 family protein